MCGNFPEKSFKTLSKCDKFTDVCITGGLIHKAKKLKANNQKTEMHEMPRHKKDRCKFVNVFSSLPFSKCSQSLTHEQY